MREGKCRLCLQQSHLHESHVIPAFVFRWLKKSGGSPFLRKGDAPNKRLQDGDTHPLYCTKCEQLLESWESSAKLKVFEPATERKVIAGNYSGWLSRFAASLAMRTIHSQQYRGRTTPFGSFKYEVVADAAENWRKFLIGQTSNPGRNKLYMLYCGYFDLYDAPNLPKNWNTFIHRAVERDIMYDERGSFCATYVKTGPLVFVGNIIGEDDCYGLPFIRCGDGHYSRINLTNSRALWNYLILRANQSNILMSGISDKQKRIINAETIKRQQEFLDSDLFKTLRADAEQFGH